jgi:thiol-disulfide isomerase/thioredoxin
MNLIKSSAILLAVGLSAAASSPDLHADPVESTHASPTAVAPEFWGIGRWLNGPPLTMSQLRGKVVLVEFWTYSCINCVRVMPYVKQWHANYRDQGLVVVGVHTPEYGYEKLLPNLQAAVERFGITYPVAQDNDYRTWNAYGNRYWPALYLIDRQGRIVYRHFGEGQYKETEARIRALLKGDAPSG